jgi:hypothetical protein
MRLYRLLILEDDLETVSIIFEELAKLENKLVNEKGVEISTVVLLTVATLRRSLVK